jgi:hypothetical protein
MTHRLVNRGTKPIVSTVYNHNFLVLDGMATGPDFVITAPFELKTVRPLDPASARVQGRQFTYARVLVESRSRLDRVPGLWRHRGGLSLHDREPENRCGSRDRGRSSARQPRLWSIRSVLALEPFVAMNIAPGGEFTWQYTYRYSTIP